MKVLHITYSLKFGGIETMLVNIANEQASHCSVSIVVIDNNFDESLVKRISQSIEFYNIGRKPGSKSPISLLKLHRIIKKNSPDIIHIHQVDIIRFIVARKYRDLVVATVHSIPDDSEIRFSKKIKQVFSISKSVQSSLSERGILSTLVYNGILSERFKYKDKWGAPFSIVQVGRLCHLTKGQDILISAVSILHKRGYDFTLTFIGDGPSRPFLESQVISLGLQNKVTFLGSATQECLFDHLKDYDLLVQPSRKEGFGLTVVEAMAAGVPTLVSAQDGPLEVIDNGRCGYMFLPGDEVDCANMIERIIKASDNQYVIESAKCRADTIFNVKNTAILYLKEYEKCIL